jgi:hypothetical protein
LENQLKYNAKTIQQIAQEGPKGANLVFRADGRLYQATNQTQYDKLTELVAQKAQATAILDELSGVDWNKLSPSDRAQARVKAQALAGILAKVEDPAAIIRESDLQRFNSWVKDPTDMVTFGKQGGYAAAREYIGARVSNVLGNAYRVYQPGERFEGNAPTAPTASAAPYGERVR